jgi:pyruvate kinase
MKIRKAKIEQLLQQLDAITNQARKAERRFEKELGALHPTNLESGRNFLHYLAFRQDDLRTLQGKLGNLGMTRLGNAEAHVVASVLAVKRNLGLLIDRKNIVRGEKASISIRGGPKRLKANTSALLGRKTKGSKARIMVTLPTEAAYDRDLVHDILASGMNCARINCAHDDEAVWTRMIENIRSAQKKTGRACKICMDLAGPKLRTGALREGPRVVHVRPERDEVGIVTVPARVRLAPLGAIRANGPEPTLPVPGDWLETVSEGELIRFRDARGKRCSLEVVTANGDGWYAVSRDSAYIVPGTRLSLRGSERLNAQVGDLDPVEQCITLKTRDRLVIHRDPEPGEPARYDETGRLTRAAHSPCTLPEVFDFVDADEPVLLDDGKIRGVITSVENGEIHVEITHARDGGERLKADKGINLPESDLAFSGLTRKDREDLTFIARNADVVNMSFVNGPKDVLDLIGALDELDAKELGIILKIETQRGFDNLPAILMAAMRRHPIGVMLARGDLAVEVGWQNLAEIQEELMMLCEAAHIPVVWATQVLETLAKKGRPSRAEISDAAMAQQAECVMLNKGPHILETIRMLDHIIASMEKHHQKKSSIKSVLRVRPYGEG